MEQTRQIMDVIKNIIKSRLFIVTTLVIITLIATWLLINSVFLTPAQKPLTISTTGLGSSNLPSLSGKNLLHYNGLSFIKTDLSTGQSSNLSNIFIPGVTSVFWASDKGAVVTVDRLRPNTALDKYYQLNVANPYMYDYPNRDFPWFIDFSNNTITPIEEVSVGGRVFSYDEERKLLYFLSATPLGENDYADDVPIAIGKPLVAWSIADKKVVSQTPMPDSSIVNSITQCSDYEVCVTTINYSTNDSKILGLKDNTLKELYKSQNKILPTNNPALFAINDTSKSGYTSEDSENAHDNLVSDISFFDIKSNSLTKEKLSLKGSTDFVVLYKPDDINVYASFNDTEIKSLHQAPSAAGNLAVASTVSTTETGLFLLHPLSFSSDIAGAIAFGSSQSHVYYVGDGKLATIPPADGVESVVKSCTDKNAGSYFTYTKENSLYSLYIPFSDSYQKTISELNKCLFSNADRVYGYNFKVSGIDSATGKIITN